MTNLQELQSACEWSGIDPKVITWEDGVTQVFLTGFDGGTNLWGGVEEDGAVAFLLRDAVRKVAPGSYVCPGGGYKPNGLTSIMNLPCYGPPGQPNETQAWANALIALWKAGLAYPPR